MLASSRTRVYQYLPYLRHKVIKCKLIYYSSSRHCQNVANLEKENLFFKIAEKIYNFYKTLIFILSVSRYDIVFIQRVLLPLTIQKFVFSLNKNIVFDFDDAIFLLNRSYNGKIYHLGNKFLSRFESMLNTSKCIVLENDYTKNYAQKFNRNILLITGPIDTRRYVPRAKKAQNKIIVLGWIGSPPASFYLEPLYKVFEMLASKYTNLVLELVGFSPQIKLEIKELNIIVKKWTLETEVADLQNFDIGLMPLYNDEWSKGKGGYKLLQYMGIGIPCVASPVGINREIIRDGVNGFFADTPKQWFDKLSMLIDDISLREKMGNEGRRLAEELYSFEANVPKLIKAFDVIASHHA